jgi:hypothetical protein
VKLVVTSVAGLYTALPPWFAANTTVPTPVTVTMLPLMVAGPLFTLSATGSPLVATGGVLGIPSHFIEITASTVGVALAF